MSLCQVEKIDEFPMPRWVDGRGKRVRGLKLWQNRNGFTVCEAHYTADPQKRSPEWIRENVIKGIPPWRRGQEYEIDWQAHGGVKMFPMWDDGVHLRRMPPLPASWARYRSIDYGRTNPFVCVWAAVGTLPENERWKTDDIHCYREYYQRILIIQAHCRNITRMSEGENIRKTYIDPSTNQMHPTERTTLRAVIRKCGIHTIPANNAKLAGIDRVSLYLLSTLARWSLANNEVHPYLDKNGYTMGDIAPFAEHPAIYFDKSMINTAREMRNLVKDEHAPSTLKKKNPKEEALTKEDHCPDVVRYLCIAQPGAARLSEEPDMRGRLMAIARELAKKHKAGPKLTEAR